MARNRRVPKVYKILIAFALICTFIICATQFLIQPWVILSDSMAPTIYNNDLLFIDINLFRYTTGINRGDIILFKPPDCIDTEELYIKRVIGLPGDEIKVSDCVTHVNGVPLDECYLMEVCQPDFGPMVLPEEYLFVMGDNRNSSLDSRCWGVLPTTNVIGKAVFRIWPVIAVGRLN